MLLFYTPYHSNLRLVFVWHALWHPVRAQLNGMAPILHYTQYMQYTIKMPRIEDGKTMWAIARDTNVLDTNSPYAYLLACTHFKATSAVALKDGEVVGFTMAYTLPDSPERLFVWQIGVHPAHHGNGIGLSMLIHLVTRENCSHITHLDATISPENTPSNNLFKKLATVLDTIISNEPYFNQHHFPSGNQIEHYISVGPIKNKTKEEII